MTRQSFKVARGLGLGGAIALTGCFLSTLLGNSAFAQIIPDGTLGAEGSLVTPNLNINGGNADRIDGGAIRGANLFHSFTQFNIGEGQGVYFANPVGIENILSRVTGNDPSDILGTLGVTDGNANLFLINPNGIIFGANARLDVGGSFVATTANAIQFGDQGLFSASIPKAPALLTVNPSAFLFNQIPARSITNQSVAGLRVPQGRSLLLLGGDVSLDGGVLLAPGGRVELGGVAGVGTVGLSVDGNNLRLSFPDSMTRADVFLKRRADVNTRACGGGSIAINAQNLTLEGASRVRTGIGPGLGSVDSKAGDIEINTTGAINLTDGSFISNAVFSVGKGGDINISTESLTLTNGAFIVSSTFGRGDGGNLTIQVRDTVSLKSGSFLSTSTLGQGNAGTLTIDAQGTVSFDRIGVDGVVDISTLGIDPVRGIVNLPAKPTTNEVAQDCQSSGGKTSGSFINTGRGGLPTTPYEPLSNNEILADVQPPSHWVDNSASPSTPKNSNRLVEANEWIINGNGEVVLVAQSLPISSQWGCNLR